MASNVQVYREPDGTAWSVRVVGDEETDPDRFESREQALAAGRRLAEERDVRLVVHDEDGQTEAKEEPG